MQPPADEHSEQPVDRSRLLFSYDMNFAFFTFTIGLMALLCGCGGLPLNKSASDIRTAILEVTPIGISIGAATSKIEELSPKTLYIFDTVPGLPRLADNRLISGDWPLGRSPQGKAIVSLLGETDKMPPLVGLTYVQVGAIWGFDESESLQDVFVSKTLTGL